MSILTLGKDKLKYLKRGILTRKKLALRKQPFISIHLTICNEPPATVLKTLRSITEADYDRYEIIIISNNTTNENSWLPIKQFAAQQGKHFIFRHFEYIRGLKAGALNKALQFTSHKAKYILTVDANYQMNEDALNLASLTHRKLPRNF